MSALPEPAPLREIRGPTAFGAGELGRFWALAWSLALMEFKVRYFGSALGYLWQLVRPLMLFGVLYVVFTEFVKFNAGVRYFPAVLLSSIVLYTFFADATASAVTSVLDRENLVRKIQFPRVVVPLATVLNSFFNLITNMGAVAVFIVATGVRPNWTWIGFPFLLFSWWPWRWAPRCWSRPCTCASATSDRSGKWSSRCSSTARRSSTRSR